MNFQAIEPVRLMLSSRCHDTVLLGGTQRPMAALRQQIKARLEGLHLDGHPVFQVWIHEDESVTDGDQDSWGTCLSKARQADVVLVLYNGRAGWVGSDTSLGGEVGICHAEFAAALYSAPTKIRTIQVQPLVKARKGSADERFQTFFRSHSLLGAQVATGEEAIVQCQQAAIAALLDLARAGVGVSSRASHYAGEAFAWSRMDFATRRTETSGVMRTALGGRPAGRRSVVRTVHGRPVAFTCDCIPAAMTIASAREMVGQPFLKDHLIVAELRPEEVGPVHLIACHRGVTEAQAIRQLGFPDATVVAAPFGVYVADDVQKIQIVFIGHCRDETTTRRGIQEFLRWMEAQGEDERLADRAAARRRISMAIRKEQRAGGAA